MEKFTLTCFPTKEFDLFSEWSGTSNKGADTCEILAHFQVRGRGTQIEALFLFRFAVEIFGCCGVKALVYRVYMDILAFLLSQDGVVGIGGARWHVEIVGVLLVQIRGLDVS